MLQPLWCFFTNLSTVKLKHHSLEKKCLSHLPQFKCSDGFSSNACELLKRHFLLLWGQEKIGLKIVYAANDTANQSQETTNATHCVKSVRIWSYSDPHFPALWLNIYSECGKMRTRTTPNTDTFHVVTVTNIINKQTNKQTNKQIKNQTGKVYANIMNLSHPASKKWNNFYQVAS